MFFAPMGWFWGGLGRRFGGVLGRSWGRLGVYLGRLRVCFWDVLRLGASWGRLGPSWWAFWAVLRGLGGTWRGFGSRFREQFGVEFFGDGFRRGQTRWSTLFHRRPPDAFEHGYPHCAPPPARGQ